MHKNEVCFFPHSVITVGQYRETHQCGERNSYGITQPSGAATPRSSDAHKRIAVPQALCALREHTRPRSKSGKVRRSDTRPGEVCERAERSECSDTTPTRNARVSACEPLCARLGAGVACVPAKALSNQRCGVCGQCVKEPVGSCSSDGELILLGWIFPPGHAPFRRFSPPICPFDKSTR